METVDVDNRKLKTPIRGTQLIHTSHQALSTNLYKHVNIFLFLIIDDVSSTRFYLVFPINYNLALLVHNFLKI